MFFHLKDLQTNIKMKQSKFVCLIPSPIKELTKSKVVESTRNGLNNWDQVLKQELGKGYIHIIC